MLLALATKKVPCSVMCKMSSLVVLMTKVRLPTSARPKKQHHDPECNSRIIIPDVDSVVTAVVKKKEEYPFNKHEPMS